MGKNKIQHLSHLVVNDDLHEHIIKTKPRGLTLQKWAEKLLIIGLSIKRIPLLKSSKGISHETI